MIFGQTRTMTKNKWWCEYIILGKFYGAALHIDFNLPTKKDKSFSFGITIFTLTLFFIEIAYLDKPIVKLEDYTNGI